MHVNRDKSDLCDLARIIRSIRGGTCNKLSASRNNLPGRLTAATTATATVGMSYRRERKRDIPLAHGGRRPSFRWFNEVINETSSLYWALAETRGTVTCPLFTVHKSARWFIDDGSSGRWASSDFLLIRAAHQIHTIIGRATNPFAGPWLRHPHERS